MTVPMRESEHYAKAKMLGEYVEIAVVVQQVVAALDAAGCDYGVDCCSDGYSKFAQGAVVSRGLDRNILSTQLYVGE